MQKAFARFLEHSYKNYLLMKKAILALLILMYSFAVFAQGIQVKGVVTSADDGQPIPGVSVVVKGTTNGTTTDIDGKYTVNAPGNSTLVFSFVGMTSKEVLINMQSTINVALATENTNIDEVVVVGYGVQKKSVITGAISSIKSKDLEKVAPGRVDQALQGRGFRCYNCVELRSARRCSNYSCKRCNHFWWWQ